MDWFYTLYVCCRQRFGKIYHDILFTNIKESGLTIDKGDITTAMALPALGMVVGLLFAVFISYRKPRTYEDIDIDQGTEERAGYTTRGIIVALLRL